jgi:hypothetical protein
MKRAIFPVAWLIVAGIALWSVLYFIAHFGSQPFVESAMGNLFATILGVFVGLPIALQVSRYQQSAAQATAVLEKLSEVAARRRKVLTLLREELQKNIDGLKDRIAPVAEGGKRLVFTHSLRNQLWVAFADGGELQYLDDPGLLATLADAYHEVAYCILLEHKFFDAIHYSGMRIQQDKYPPDHILDYLTKDDDGLMKSMQAAGVAIDAELAARP